MFITGKILGIRTYTNKNETPMNAISIKTSDAIKTVFVSAAFVASNNDGQAPVKGDEAHVEINVLPKGSVMLNPEDGTPLKDEDGKTRTWDSDFEEVSQIFFDDYHNIVRNQVLEEGAARLERLRASDTAEALPL